MTRLCALAAIAAIALSSTPAAAWEPETTHAGLAEQAALSSRLHKRLVTLGFPGGLFEPLTIPPADAPALLAAVKLLSPTHGAVPDARGRQAALAWLAAGAAIADIPAQHGANHFYDPQTRRGWERPDRGAVASMKNAVREALSRPELPERGVPAPDWVTSKANPFNLDNFLAQYEKAVTARTPGERSRHMAAALVAAGAMLHVLGDLGAPSRVRGDEAAHFDFLGGGPDDLGSRFERIAALAYGRLGVPGPSRVVTRTRLRDFYSAPGTGPEREGEGLADRIARSYFSPNTLPEKSRVGGDTRPALARPEPALPSRLNLMAASRGDGTTLRDRDGTCLARYKVDHGVLEFSLDDDCVLEQVAAILPEVAAYQTGLLDFLLRGELTLEIADQLVVRGAGLGAGTLDILVEDASGVRTSLGKTEIAGGQEILAQIAAPTTGSRIVAVFRGVDASGEPVVAVGATALPR